MTMVKVARMPQTVEYGDKKYGPSDGPMFIPLELAVALGLRHVDGGSAVAASDDAQAQELTAAQNLAGQFQRNLELLVEQLRPHVNTAINETPDQTLERLLREREQGQKMSRKVVSVENAIQQEKANNERLTQEAGDLRQEVVRLTTDLKNTQEAYHDYRAEMEGKVDDLTKERDDAHQALAAAKLLPDDALDRLESVNGISKALAQKGLDALLAPAKSE